MKDQGKVIKDFKKKIHNLKQPVVLKWLYRIGIFIFVVLFALGRTLTHNLHSDTTFDYEGEDKKE
jgi:hypothetical protein